MQIIKKYTLFEKNVFFFKILGFFMVTSFPVMAFAQAPYVPTPVSQPLTQPLLSSTPSQANLHSNTSANTQPSPQAQTVTVPNGTSVPITMTVTTNINNPQTQTAPVLLQNQNTVSPILAPQLPPCPPSNLQSSPLLQQSYKTQEPYGSLCAPSLDRNLYLTSTYDMLVPRRHLYSSDPAKTSKPEPRIYTRNPLVRKEQVVYFQPDATSFYGTSIGISNRKTSNQDLNASIRERERELWQREFQVSGKGERVIVYPVINRGDGVRALGIIQSNSSNSKQSQTTPQNTAVAPQRETREPASTALQEIKASEAENSVNTNLEIYEEIQK